MESGERLGAMWWRQACAAGLTMLAVMAACSDRAPYRLGVVASTDGMRGAELAARDINKSGGVRGRPIELHSVGGASSSNAAIALQVAETLAADARVLAVIGHANSSASLAASQVYNARRVVQVAPTSTTPLFSAAGPYSFRLVGSDEFQGRFLADEIVAERPKRVAVVYVNDDYGRALHRSLEAELRQRGVATVRAYPYAEQDTSGRRELVAALAHQRPEMLAWLGRVGYFALVAAPLRAALPSLRIVASDGFGGPEVDADPRGLFAGVRHARLTDMGRADTLLQRVRRQYRTEAGADMSDEAALSYDAVLLLAEAVRAAGPDRPAIRDWMARVGRTSPAFTGVTGPIVFTDSGDRVPHYVLVTAGSVPPSPAPR